MRNTTTSTRHLASPLASAIGSALREFRACAPGRAALVVAVLAVGAADVQAQSVWTNPGAGDWFDAGNWSAGVPDSTDDADIGNDGTARLSSGGAAAADIYLGRAAGESGGLVVDAGGVLDTGNFYVGYAGDGSLTIRNGGTLHSTTGTIGTFLSVPGFGGGDAVVEGAGSTWNVATLLTVGGQNNGSLVIRDGGVVNSGSGVIGDVCRESTPLVCGSGHGSVLVSGNGSAWNIADGALQIGSAFYSFRGGRSGSGELTISDGGRVSVAGDAGVLLGDFNVGGSVSGAGTLNIGGGADEAATGAGILDAAFVEGRGSDATLNFNHVDGDYWFTRDGTAEGDWVAVTGTTQVNHLGPGRTVLGDSTYSGDTTVSAGTLLIGGDSVLGGHVSIFDGATFGGTATVGSIDNAGALAPGIDGIGTLTITGDYVHRDGAFLWIDLDGPESDRLVVAGTATLEGGTVMIGDVQGQVTGGTRYTILRADGGVEGVFDTLVDGLPSDDRPFIDLLFGYDANHVYLDVVRTGVAFSDVCVGFNACGVATSLDASVDEGVLPDDFMSVLRELTTLDEAQAQRAFDTLSGEVHASLENLVLERRGLVVRAIDRRIDGRRGDRHDGPSGWIRAYGTSAELEGKGFASADYDTRGISAGFDTRVGAWLVGAGVDVARLDAGFSRGHALPVDTGESDTRDVFVYAGFDGARAYIDAVASHGWSDNTVSRHIVVGDLARTARADYDGKHSGAYVEGGLQLGDERHRWRPFVSLQYDKAEQDAFAETGAGDVGLIGRGDSIARTTAGIGLAWSTTINSGAWSVEPMIDVRRLHASGDLSARFDAAFTGSPGSHHAVRGIEVPADRTQLGLGLVAHRGQGLGLFVEYDYQHGDELEHHELGAGVRVRW